MRAVDDAVAAMGVDADVVVDDDDTDVVIGAKAVLEDTNISRRADLGWSSWGRRDGNNTKGDEKRVVVFEINIIVRELKRVVAQSQGHN